MSRRFLLLFLAACSSSDPSAGPTDTTTPVTPPACADGFTADPRGLCIETIALDCKAGTRPSIGSKSCVSVGPVGCSHADPSGWGCIDDPAPAACEGTTRESDGACVPIGDCTAAFPPAGAIVVDPTLAAEDATHKKTIAAAMAASSAGGTIAIESGTYAEPIHIVTNGLSVVGRCAEKVLIQPTGVDQPGVLVEHAKAVKISGLSVKGTYGGIDVYTGSDATIDSVYLEGTRNFGIIADSSSAVVSHSKISNVIVQDNRGGWGISAGAGASVDVLETNVTGGTTAVYVGTDDASISVSKLVASGQAPQGTIRAGGFYSRGGRLTIDKSYVHDIEADAAAAVEGKLGRITMRESVVRDIHSNGATARGYGISAVSGAFIELYSSTILRPDSSAIFERDSGTSIELHQSVVRGPEKVTTQPDKDLFVTSEGSGLGFTVTGSAKLLLDDVAAIGVWGWGIYATSGATVDAKKLLIQDMHDLEPTRTPPLPYSIGVQSDNATVKLEDAVISGGRLAGIVAGRKGTVSGSRVYVQAVKVATDMREGMGLGVGEEGVIDLDASAVVGTFGTGITSNAGAGSTVKFTHGTVHGVKSSDEGAFGHGVVVAQGASVVMEGSSIYENHGIGIAVSGGKARLASCVIADNPVALHVQEGSFVTETATDDDLADNEVRVSPDNRFVDNATRLGTGEIPMPTNVLP